MPGPDLDAVEITGDGVCSHQQDRAIAQPGDHILSQQRSSEKGTEGSQTRRWREMDSNHRSLSRGMPGYIAEGEFWGSTGSQKIAGYR